MQKFFACVYIFLFALKALQVLNFEFCQIKLITYKLANNWQNFARVGLQLKLTFRIWPLEVRKFQ